LDILLSNIDFDRVHTWYIIYDIKVPFKRRFNSPHIIEVACTDANGISGNQNRNMALDMIPDSVPNSIDTSQFVFDASLLNGLRFDRHKYNADGWFIYNLLDVNDNKKHWHYIDKTMSFYNAISH